MLMRFNGRATASCSKLLMRDTLIPAAASAELFDAAMELTRTLLYDLAQGLINGC
jgi:hypothetical protein